MLSTNSSVSQNSSSGFWGTSHVQISNTKFTDESSAELCSKRVYSVLFLCVLFLYIFVFVASVCRVHTISLRFWSFEGAGIDFLFKVIDYELETPRL